MNPAFNRTYACPFVERFDGYDDRRMEHSRFSLAKKIAFLLDKPKQELLIKFDQRIEPKLQSGPLLVWDRVMTLVLKVESRLPLPDEPGLPKHT